MFATQSYSGQGYNKDEDAVSTVVRIINDWVNPFVEKQDLINISTAKTVTRDIASDLLVL